ncbi:MAG: GH3 auxin-responsive promoter family protein [Bacteroidales bacterium]|nr:GH3 auxin-responsive promoter family protein [Bacteroidales bacterium]
MALLNTFLSWYMRKRMHQIELFVKYPHDVQEEWFKKLITAGKNTQWGKVYDYGGIRNIEDFKRKVPINSYDDLKPYIDKLMKGEQNVLWSSDIKWMAKSSGTTSDKSKFIPVSEEALEDCHFKGGKDVLTLYCTNYPDTRLFDGKALALGGSHQINEYNNESYYGDLSAILIQNLPFWAEFYRTPSRKIALMDEWESKIDKMASAIMQDDITNISGVPSWTLLLLKRVLELSNKNNISELWPNLELFIHGGVSFVPYVEEFKKIIPSKRMNYLETYNASEGFFGIQDTTYSKDLLLMLDYGIFYEFLPLDKLNDENPQTLNLDTIETGINYALIISTNAGLWRYIIGDTIMFTSKNPYRIKITGRTKSFINTFGEELIIDNAISALRIACEKTSAQIKDYTAGPVFLNDNNSASHQWLIEFSKQPDNLDYFSEILDNALKSLNSDYEAKRHKDMMLKLPLVQSVPSGTFYEWMKRRGKLGGQNKVPRLSNDRKYLDEILKIISD